MQGTTYLFATLLVYGAPPPDTLAARWNAQLEHALG